VGDSYTSFCITTNTPQLLPYRVTDGLNKVRPVLYDVNEEAALWNPGDEKWRRMMAAIKEGEKREGESRLVTAQP
jgi:hypothetical protein